MRSFSAWYRQYALLVACGLCTGGIAAQQPCQPVNATGAKGLYIGHSFFVPVSRSFDDLASANAFPDHREFDFVGSGGDGGTPEMLYENSDGSRDAVLARLTPDVEILGMTVGTPELSDEEDFATWIDIALDANPDMRIFIGVPWTPSAFTMPPAVYDVVVEASDDSVFATVEALRVRYPSTQIDMVNYGHAVAQLYTLQQAGQLPDVDCLYPPECQTGDVPLFTDPGLGHGGPIVHEVSALVWMNALYGADIASLQFTEYQADVVAVVNQTLDYNCQFAADLCPADTNGDGQLTPADFNGWIIAFNDNAPECDQNDDSLCTPADFSGWILNFNAGC